MFKLYRQSQDAQRLWIRNHPVQYVALNATLIAMIVGYWMYQERKEKREIENQIVQQEK